MCICHKIFLVLQTELISGDQNGNIRVWDLTANSCSCELVCLMICISSYIIRFIVHDLFGFRGDYFHLSTVRLPHEILIFGYLCLVIKL